MKVLEVKNNLVKTDFSAKDNVILGGFLVIEDSKNPYVSQVMNVKEDSKGATAISKLMFTFDKEGVLRSYNGSVPAVNSPVSLLPVNELLDILPFDDPLRMGRIAQERSLIAVDSKVLEDNFLVCSDKHSDTELFTRNLLVQLNDSSKRNVVFDLDGHFVSDKKIKFAEDFKIPLNYDTIDYIYEKELSDVDQTSKAIIQDILIELQEYSKKVKGEFIPFDTFLDIIDMQYKETKIPQLVLLKNKLMKYKENGIFAQTFEEAQSLRLVLKEYDSVVIDLSGVDCNLLQEQILEFAYRYLSELDQKTYAFIRLEEENAKKTLLKLLTTSIKVLTTIICPHNFKYIKELKSIAKNIVFFAPISSQHDFATYNTLLNKLNAGEFIIIGDSTQQIPFIVKSEIINPNEEIYQEFETIEPQAKAHVENKNVEYPESEVLTEKQVVDATSKESEAQNEFEKEEKSKPLIIPQKVMLEEPETETYSEMPQIPDADDDEEPKGFVKNNDTITEEYDDNINVEPLNDMEQEPEIFEPVEISESIDQDGEEDIEIVEEPQISEDDLYDEASDEIIENNSYIEENLDADVEELDSNADEANPFEDPSILEDDISINEEDLTDNLDDIDENIFDEDINKERETTRYSTKLSSDFGNASDNDLKLAPSEYDDYEPPSAFESVPVIDIVDDPSFEDKDTEAIPVYPALELNGSQNNDFNTGDRVSHPTYGMGVVEKVISYGDKKLCSIMFESNNRRLLDPAISSVVKL